MGFGKTEIGLVLGLSDSVGMCVLVFTTSMYLIADIDPSALLLILLPGFAMVLILTAYPNSSWSKGLGLWIIAALILFDVVQPDTSNASFRPPPVRIKLRYCSNDKWNGSEQMLKTAACLSAQGKPFPMPYLT